MAEINDIRQRFCNALKISGAKNVITVSDGSLLPGRYYLCESGTVTASHDPKNGFSKSPGFPTDRNGTSVNDRDYERDTVAQEITRQIARNYDARAIQNPVIVSCDGIVLSGNGRTMAGELAARDNTDKSYIDYLLNYGQSYGFTAVQVSQFCHPRLIFVLDDVLPYTATTFARFNAKDMKSQSKAETAIKFGKLIDGATFGRIITIINSFDTLGDFYSNTEAVTRCINDLRNCGVIDNMSYAEMFDGDTVSSIGKETLENVLIGKAFENNPDCARMITTYKSLRKSVVFALSEIANNLTLGEDYTLQNDLTEAIRLAYEARNHGYKDGERVSEYALQIDVFSGTANFDNRNRAVLILADTVNSEKITLLKKVMAVYNKQGKESSIGQTDMFSSNGVKTKSEILEEVKAIFAKGTAQVQNKAVSDAKEQRLSENIFVSEESAKKVTKGGYVEYKTYSGETIICQVSDIIKNTVYLKGYDGIKLSELKSRVKPTANHLLNLPSWLVPGNVISNARASQRITEIIDGTVFFEWINGGYFEADLASVLQSFKPSKDSVCKLMNN